jgi:hypothetical protein
MAIKIDIWSGIRCAGWKGENVFGAIEWGIFFWVWSGIDKENGGMKRSFMMECVK